MKPPQINRRPPLGFSLIEVALALGIMAFAGLSIYGLFPVGLNAIQTARIDMVATRIAERTQADLQQVELGANAVQVEYFDSEGAQTTQADAIYDAYRSEIDHRLPGDASGGGLQRVRLQVVCNPGRQTLSKEADGWTVVPATMSARTFCFYVQR